MYNISGENLTQVFYFALRSVLEHGTELPSRWNTNKELHPAMVTIHAPDQRVLLAPGRKNNLAAAIFETMWVLSGQDDISLLTRFLPRAPMFSDDSKTWRGAYGPRLRSWPDYNHERASGGLDVAVYELDQVKVVYDHLRHKLDSRQAVMVIFDPAKDNVESKDIPCNNMLYFLVRNGKLDVTATIRSNDIFWGFSQINVFEWTMLQEFMADWLCLPVGTYYHMANSFHLYNEHWKSADDILGDEWAYEQNAYRINFDNKPLTPPKLPGFDNFSNVCSHFFSAVRGAFAIADGAGHSEDLGVIGHTLEVFEGSKMGDYLRVVLMDILLIKQPEMALSYAFQLPEQSDVQLGALIRANRRSPGFVQSFKNTTTEYLVDALT